MKAGEPATLRWWASKSFLTELIRLDPGVVEAHVDEHRATAQVSTPADVASLATVVGAVAAAARGAAFAAHETREHLEFSALKKHIDGAATSSAEAILMAAKVSIRVSAGEGERDSSPGAVVGQRLGRSDRTTQYNGVFDYVDGTALAAAGLPGALSLGGLGRGLRSVPDLQAFAVLVPSALTHEVDIMATPEDVGADSALRIARHVGRSASDLVVATHSLSSNCSHETLVQRLRALVARVLVPDPVTIEPPYLLSLAGLAEPRIDSMIGAIGLSELAFAALLLDLVLPDYVFVFRLGGLEAWRSSRRADLAALFDLSEREREAYARTGWDVAKPYTSRDIVPRGNAVAAALFAVTANDMLRLAAPLSRGPFITANGLALTPGGGVARMRVVSRRLSPGAPDAADGG